MKQHELTANPLSETRSQFNPDASKVMKSRRMAYGLKTAVLFSATLVLMVAGCTAGRGFPRVLATRVPRTHAQSAPLTGARLSALIPTPTGFTLDPATSFNSGTREAIPVPGSSDAGAVDCASWWSGKAYFGPGTIGYAVKNYTGSSRVTLHFDVNLYPAGTGAGVFDMSVAVQRRCHRFSYRDNDGQRYLVNATVGPSAGIGDRSLEVNATETAADGAVFITQTTFIEVGDALVVATETGSVGAPVNRVALPLAAIAASLRSAGY
jgi:hypothetical protein